METPQEMKARHAEERRKARRVMGAWEKFARIADAELSPEEFRVFIGERMSALDSEPSA